MKIRLTHMPSLRFKIAPLVAAAAGLFVLPIPTLAQKVDQVRLRELLQLPQVEMALSYSLDARGDLTTEVAAIEAPHEAARLRKILKDNSDPAEWVRLSRLYYASGNTSQGGEAARKAVDLYSRLAKAKPADTTLATNYGRALSNADMNDAALGVLKKVIVDAPEQWQARIALGEALHLAAIKDLYGAGGTTSGDADAWAKLFTTGRPTAEKITSAQRLRDEATASYNKAVALAPKEPTVYIKRAAYMIQRATYIDVVLEALSKTEPGKPGDMTKLGEKMRAASSNQESQADTERAVKASPDSYTAVSTDTMLTLLASMNASPSTYGTVSFWTSLPESIRKRFQERMADLKRIAGGTNKDTSSQAYALLGLLQYTVTAESKASESSFRKALDLNPNLSEAYEGLIGILVSQKHFEELLPVAQARIKSVDTPRNHLLSAKLYEKLGKMTEAESEIDKALALDPDDQLCNLSKATLEMRHAGDVMLLSDAGERLKRVSELYTTIRSASVYMPLVATTVIYYGLTDRPDEAREELKQGLEYSKDDDLLKKIKAALGS